MENQVLYSVFGFAGHVPYVDYTELNPIACPSEPSMLSNYYHLFGTEIVSKNAKHDQIVRSWRVQFL